MVVGTLRAVVGAGAVQSHEAALLGVSDDDVELARNVNHSAGRADRAEVRGLVQVQDECGALIADALVRDFGSCNRAAVRRPASEMPG